MLCCCQRCAATEGQNRTTPQLKHQSTLLLVKKPVRNRAGRPYLDAAVSPRRCLLALPTCSAAGPLAPCAHVTTLRPLQSALPCLQAGHAHLQGPRDQPHIVQQASTVASAQTCLLGASSVHVGVVLSVHSCHALPAEHPCVVCAPHPRSYRLDRLGSLCRSLAGSPKLRIWWWLSAAQLALRYQLPASAPIFVGQVMARQRTQLALQCAHCWEGAQCRICCISFAHELCASERGHRAAHTIASTA